jgi:hypothetical protein
MPKPRNRPRHGGLARGIELPAVNPRLVVFNDGDSVVRLGGEETA